MNKKLKTMTVQGGAEYAKVNTRLLEFRKDCPKGSVETKPEMLDGGQMFFTATVIKNLADANSARATGSAYGKVGGAKAFEKLECVPLDTEILTRDGFKFYYELKFEELVLTYNIATGKNEWQKISGISGFDNVPVVEISTSRFKAICTANHKWVVSKLGKSKLVPLDKIEMSNGSNKIILSAPEEDKKPVLKEDTNASKLAWLFTDGEVRYTKNGLPTSSFIQQSKPDNVEVIKKLFGEPTSSKKHIKENWLESYIWHISADEVRKLFGFYQIRNNKDLPKLVSKMNLQEVKSFFNSAMKADGYINGFGKTYYETVEAMQICATRLGIKTGAIKQRVMEKSTKPFYCFQIHKGNGAYTSEIKIRNLPPKDVWCPTVKNGTWVARQNGQVWITGNTIAVGRALAFLGYGADGAIASSEEMEEFFEYQNEKKIKVIAEMQQLKTLDELKTYFLSLGNLMSDETVIKAKDEMKIKLEK